MSDLNHPRQHLLDVYSDWINFLEYNTQEGATVDYMQNLNTSLAQAM